MTFISLAKKEEEIYLVGRHEPLRLPRTSTVLRLMQRARGYTATMVAGEITYRDGEATGALPGRLVRGPQGAAKESQR